MQIQEYRFHCRFTSPARLPGYPGSTLRGALGWALKKTCCVLRNKECQDCLLRDQCAYGWLFATEAYTGSKGQRVNARPHPLVIRPEPAAKMELQAGEPLRFSMLLFGRGNDYLPHLVHAVRHMGRSGIGQGRGQGMGRFAVQQVTAGGETCFSSSDDILKRPSVLRELSLDLSGLPRADAIRCTLLTPLRLKRGNRLQLELPFAELIRACLRRVSALEAAYGPGEPDLDYAGLIKQAEKIRIKNPEVRWQELFRWSNRQRKKISLAGLAGTCVYTGELAPFQPLLTYCQEVHIGKQTIFGLGRMAILPEK